MPSGALRRGHRSYSLLSVDNDSSTLEDFPVEMEMFANDMQNFRKALNGFPEYFDESVDETIYPFEEDLQARTLWSAEL